MKKDSDLVLHVGIKTDPIEYRYSYEWLFRLMVEEGIQYAQLGSFFELYQLPDEFFTNLRRQAEGYGVSISSLFTTHRELGGFLRREEVWQAVTRHNHKRLIQVGALLGAETVGTNLGAVMRDQMDQKEAGIKRYVRYMKELLGYAYRVGVSCLTVETMSCLAEPPTLPDEIRDVAEELITHHRQHPDQTASFGYCVDVAHGYADQERKVCWDNMQLLEAALPYMREIHLKNTDEHFGAVFGFSPEDRERGIVHIDVVRDYLLRNADLIPIKTLIGYLEIGGPKRGRDYSDYQLEGMLRESLRYLRDTFRSDLASR